MTDETEPDAAEGALERQARKAVELMRATPGPIAQAFISHLALPPEALETLRAAREANADRYRPLIEQARRNAAEADGIAVTFKDPATLPRADTDATRQVAAMGAVRDEVAGVAKVVATMAETVEPLLTVAQDAQDGLLRLEAEARATRAETGRLREALLAGQASADKVAKRILRATWVLVVLTVVVAILTLELILRART